ncbi:MAG: flagellar biosynthetic protein FliO [Lachnospiraceae bacterium]|nr:flagellar biosynthetic protein FliO [Lachnospiraceae bacterium]MBR5179142.1 flagellar biosynthetic protein FliO [Lachnospiraceae bacterium]
MPYRLVFAATDFLNGEGGGIKSVLKLIGLIILCILIIVASYYTTKFVGKKQLGRTAKSNFRSIDIFRISTNKYLQIVEIGERYFCIAVAKDTITVVGELSKDDIKNFPPEIQEKSFKETMSEILKKKDNTNHKKPGEILNETKLIGEDEGKEDSNIH